MIRFLIKKAFYDGWDAFLPIVLLNVVCISISFIGFFLAGKTLSVVPISVLIVVLVVLLEGVLGLAVSSLMARISAFESFSPSDFFSAIKETWLHGVFFSLIVVMCVLVFSAALPFYMGLENRSLGIVLSGLLFWIAVLLVLSLQWFFPVRSQLETNFVKCIKKCFSIFFDNPAFSIFMFLYSAFLLVCSLFLVLLVPGFAGLILAHNEAFRLLQHKYDWLETQSELDLAHARKHIPWQDLIADDEKIIGNRSLKNILFPWKE